jgi:hypothetical protein
METDAVNAKDCMPSIFKAHKASPVEHAFSCEQPYSSVVGLCS